MLIYSIIYLIIIFFVLVMDSWKIRLKKYYFKLIIVFISYKFFMQTLHRLNFCGFGSSSSVFASSDELNSSKRSITLNQKLLLYVVC